MANKAGHRRFGTIRKLPPGRFQVRYPGPDGRMRSATRTFAERKEAERYLVIVEGQLIRAALIYQHATSGADRAIAEAMDVVLAAEVAEEATGKGVCLGLGASDEADDDGGAGVLVPVA